MANILPQQIHWIVRTVGERTTEACVRLAAEAARGEPVTRIRETPFVNAVRRTWESGRASGKPWTVCLDADVLIDPVAMWDFLEEAFATDQKTFCVQAVVLDNLLAIHRPAGIHVYRNRYAAEALQHVPAAGVALRPETHTNEQLIANYRVLRQSNRVIGLHDFEQDYADLHRKGMVHAKKHWLVWERLSTRWEVRRHTEPDIRAAWLGARALPDTEAPFRIDVAYGAARRAQDLAASALAPKAPLTATDCSAEWVREVMAGFPVDEILQPLRYSDFDRSVEKGRKPPPWVLAYRRLRPIAGRYKQRLFGKPS